MDDTRYYDLKGDTTRLEVNVQEADRPLILTGPYSTSSPHEITALEENDAVKAITLDAYTAATDVSKLTVAQLDEKYGNVDGYPVDANKDAKVAFAKTQGGN